MSRDRYHVQSSTTTKTYVYCRIAATDALAYAQAEPLGSFYFNMMAAICAAFTVEAFLNHIGEKKLKDWRAIERTLSPQDKLALLSDRLRFTVDRSRRPFQTFKLMLRVRDALAHGKTSETTVSKTVTRVREDHRWPEPEWKRLCEPRSVAKMVADAEAIVRDLNQQVGSKRDPFISPGGGSSLVRAVRAGSSAV